MAEIVNVYLVGYLQSKAIIPSSSYLLNKYVHGLRIYFLNFGNYGGRIFGAKYESLGRFRLGGIRSWSRHMIKFLEGIQDEYLVFALDDYLISTELNQKQFEKLYRLISSNSDIACIKLHASASWDTSNYEMLNSEIFKWKNGAPYSVTTQWTLWRRSTLIEVLSEIRTPWDFEVKGSAYLSNSGMHVLGTTVDVVTYPSHSAISKRHPKKISVIGNALNDIENMLELGILIEEDLIFGQWIGKVPSYSEFKNSPNKVLDNCPPSEKLDYQKWLELTTKVPQVF